MQTAAQIELGVHQQYKTNVCYSFLSFQARFVDMYTHRCWTNEFYRITQGNSLLLMTLNFNPAQGTHHLNFLSWDRYF